MCLFFPSVEYFVSSFCVPFSLQPFSNLVYACIWHLGNRKSTLRSFAFLCFLGHYLHFTFFAVKKNCWKRRESWKISSGLYVGSGWVKSGPLEHAQLANQIQGFRVPDRSDAWENKNVYVFKETIAKFISQQFNLGQWAISCNQSDGRIWWIHPLTNMGKINYGIGIVLNNTHITVSTWLTM